MFRKYCVVQFLESSKLILPEMQTQCSFKTPSATDACHHHGVEVAKQLDAKYHFGLCWAGGPKVYCRKGVVFCFGSLVVGLLETESSSTRLGFPGAHCVAQAVRTHTWPTMLTALVPAIECFWSRPQLLLLLWLSVLLHPLLLHRVGQGNVRNLLNEREIAKGSCIIWLYFHFSHKA